MRTSAPIYKSSEFAPLVDGRQVPDEAGYFPTIKAAKAQAAAVAQPGQEVEIFDVHSQRTIEKYTVRK